MKEIWYRIIDFGYLNNPWKPWEKRHVRVTIGEEKIENVYYLFNPEPEKVEYVEYTGEEDFTQIEVRKSFQDIEEESLLLGVCGKLEIIKSDNREEFKIEFL